MPLPSPHLQQTEPMAAVVITAQNTRLADAESTTNWVGTGGGAGGALETDFFFQGSSSFARKGTTSGRGIGLSDNVNSDLSGAGTYVTIMFKYICTTPGLLETVATPGFTIDVGSGSSTTRATNRYEYYVQGNDTYPIDKSWLVLPINPNIAVYRDNTNGTPNLTIVDYYGIFYDQTGTSKSPNQGMDAVDIGSGLTLVGGDGGDPDGTWQDISDHDWGTVVNRFGYLRENEGVFLVYGMMIIGTATATVFTDDSQLVLFPDGLFGAGFSGVTIDLQSATSVCTMISIVYRGQGTITDEDTRPVWIVTGTSGSFTASACTFLNFESMTLTSACTLDGGSVAQMELLVQSDAVIVNSVIRTDSLTSIATLQDPNFSNLSDTTFEQAGAGHAIEIDTVGAYAFDNLKFNSYGADASDSAALDVTASSGTVTINILNGGDTPSFKTAGATVVIVNAVVVSATALDANTAVGIEDARLLLEAAPGGDLPAADTVTITRATTTATVAHTAHGMSSGGQVMIRGADAVEYLGLQTITVTGVNEYTFTVSGSPTTPATGTIDATSVILEGLSSAAGLVANTGFSYTSDQPVTGVFRRGTTSPYYKSAGISGTITSTGFSTNVAMVRDE